ncbi:MAG TPA: CAP domain-containing protein, partial [Verrucomicrobiae bacterium]|nr:CAP domain-containing protein [Verrucomicrobiae bacterium]
MRTLNSTLLIVASCLFVLATTSSNAQQSFILGDAPHAPTDLSGLPGKGVRPLSVTGGFTVDINSREQVRSFYNAVYSSSDGTPMGTTADVSSCTPGTNSTAFKETVLRRINWFRAMAGLPASITFDAGDSAKDQQAAVMMSSNNKLQHVGDWTGWSCFTTDGTNASANSNLALGSAGPDAVSGYIWDYGANNYEVGHRRWILYPQTQVMGTGDVPAQGSTYPANAVWVFDANYGGPRPATRTPYTAWPPAGYVPYQVVYPRWSFAYPNANLASATITMQSNGVPVAVTKETYLTGFGENTVVWYPSSLNPASTSTIFPFSGTDTVYTITVGNISGAPQSSYTYTVTVFDPAVPGADYFPPTLSGPSQPYVNTPNAYACTAITNATSYQWRTSQAVSGNLADGAENGLVNFTISPTPIYPVITNSPVASGSHSFHLTHTNLVPQLLQLSELLYPATNTQVTFKSLLGYAGTAETAKVQASGDGGLNWQDLYSLAGNGGQVESSFGTHTLSLSNYVGKATLLRFNYYYPGYGGYFPQTFTSPPVGWFIDDIVVTNTQQLINIVTNSTASTNFTFTPTVATNYSLEARALIFTEFPLGWGPVKQVTAIAAPPTIVLGAPVIANNQIQVDFTLQAGSAATFRLLNSDQVNGPWTTNT